MAFKIDYTPGEDLCCPNGHPLQPINSLGANHCVTCGYKLIKVDLHKSVVCSLCDRPVNLLWIYCPWCSRAL